MDLLGLFPILLIAVVVTVVVLVLKNRGTVRPPSGAEADLSIDTGGGVPEGWYRDPDGKPSERYFDGAMFTEQVRPLTARSAAQIAPNAGSADKPSVDAAGNPISPSSRLVALLLCIFLGFLGVHRFYVNKTGTGVAQLLTLGGLGIWVFVDFILIIAGAFRDKQNRPVLNW